VACAGDVARGGTLAAAGPALVRSRAQVAAAAMY